MMAPIGLPPVVLRIGGALLLLLPIAGFFTGVYFQPGAKKFAAIAQAIVYVFLGLKAFRLAKSRES